MKHFQFQNSNQSKCSIIKHPQECGFLNHIMFIDSLFKLIRQDDHAKGQTQIL